MKPITAALVVATLLAPHATLAATAPQCQVVAEVDALGYLVAPRIIDCDYPLQRLMGTYSLRQMMDALTPDADGIIVNGLYRSRLALDWTGCITTHTEDGRPPFRLCPH